MMMDDEIRQAIHRVAAWAAEVEFTETFGYGDSGPLVEAGERLLAWLAQQPAETGQQGMPSLAMDDDMARVLQAAADWADDNSGDEELNVASTLAAKAVRNVRARWLAAQCAETWTP